MENEVVHKEKAGLAKGQKIALAVLLFFSFAVVIFGIGRIFHNINSPFVFIREVFERNKNRAFDAMTKGQREIIALQAKDTDRDGLSDFEEMYIHGTSPYLEDTDSDGISDKQEIDAQDNPNCPEGRICGSAVSEEPLPGTANFQAAQSALPPGGTESVRQALLQAGMSKDLLDQVDDNTLLQLYGETMSETGINPAQIQGGQQVPAAINSEIPVSISDPQASAKANLVDYFQNMSTEEIREFLISSGMSAELLQQVDDETIRELLDQALQEQIQIQAQAR